MSSHPTDFQGSVIDALREAIERQIPDSRAGVSGGGGHFNIEVVLSRIRAAPSARLGHFAFEGQGAFSCQC